MQLTLGTSSDDDAKQFSGGHSCAYERDCCLCLLGWGVGDGVNGLMTYMGRRNVCIWISPSMGVGDLLKLEREMGDSVRGEHMWYSLKFDRRMLASLEKDEDVVKLVRSNDGHAYVYIAGKDGPRAGPVGEC